MESSNYKQSRNTLMKSKVKQNIVALFTKSHYSYHANSWLVKITSNGRYVLAPTIYGQIFVFNMKTGKVSAIIKEHEGKQ